MNYSHPQVRRTARRIPVLCAVYFVVFTFLELYLLQCDVLAQIQFQLSEGATVYHPLFAALFCTFLLALLGLFLERLLHWLPLRAKALTWFVPFLLVGVLTHWHFPQFGDAGSSPRWWVFLLLFVAYFFGLFVAYSVADSPKTNRTFATYAWPNALLLMSFTAMSVGLSNTDIVLHRTLRAASLSRQGRFAEVLQTARWEQHPSRQLSVLTAMALSETGQLGERLFAYPQPWGSEGLLPQLGDTAQCYNLPLAVGQHLGYKRGEHIAATRFLQVADTLPKAHAAVYDYLLCAHLLDRNLSAFVRRLTQSDSLSPALPLHYREALVLDRYLYHPQDTLLRDEALDSLYLQFDSLRNDAGTKAEREFRCRCRFGATYWCYYFFR